MSVRQQKVITNWYPKDKLKLPSISMTRVTCRKPGDLTIELNRYAAQS